MTTTIGADSARRPRRGPGRRTAIALFLLPALVLYAVFVLFPIFQAVHYSFFKWNGLTPLTDFIGLANYQRALADPVFQGAVQHNVLVIVLSLIVQIPFALGLALMLSRRFRGRTILRLVFFAPYVIAEVITGVVWSLLLQPSGLADGLLHCDRPGLALPAVAGRPEHGHAGDVLRHLVEVLRLPHDPVAGRPAGHPARARGSGRDRRRHAAPDDPLRDPAAARADPARVGLPVDHRRPAAVRSHLGHHRRRPGQRLEHDGDVHVRLGVQALPARVWQRGRRDPVRVRPRSSPWPTSAGCSAGTSRAP